MATKSMQAKAKENTQEALEIERAHEEHLLILSLTADIIRTTIEKNPIIVFGRGKPEIGLKSFTQNTYAALADARKKD